VFEVWLDILSSLCWKFTAKSVDRWKTSEHGLHLAKSLLISTLT